jgi:hypothetical protein
MRFGCLRQHALRLLFVAFLVHHTAKAQRQWPSCLPSGTAASTSDQSRQGIPFLEIPASATGCSLALVQGDTAPPSAVWLSSNTVIAGNSLIVLLLFTRLIVETGSVLLGVHCPRCVCCNSQHLHLSDKVRQLRVMQAYPCTCLPATPLCSLQGHARCCSCPLQQATC